MTENLNRGVPEDTGTEVAGTEVATFTGAEGAELPTGQTSVMVARPAPGETVQIESAPGQTYVLDFNPSEARAQVDGDNLILVFEDDGRVIFENLVELAQLGENARKKLAGSLRPIQISCGWCNETGRDTSVAGGQCIICNGTGTMTVPLKKKK